jgi:hypothetical protein
MKTGGAVIIGCFLGSCGTSIPSQCFVWLRSEPDRHSLPGYRTIETDMLVISLGA